MQKQTFAQIFRAQSAHIRDNLLVGGALEDQSIKAMLEGKGDT
jgi:hypothetical protein